MRTGGRHPFWLVWLLVAVSLTACDPHDSVASAAKTDAEKTDVEVSLVLVPGSDSKACCGIVTVNPGDRSVRVFCEVVAFDPQGRLIYAGLVPGPKPGVRRDPMTVTSGMQALPGSEKHGWTDLPIDLTRDRYRSDCRVAIWHGAPPL